MRYIYTVELEGEGFAVARQQDNATPILLTSPMPTAAAAKAAAERLAGDGAVLGLPAHSPPGHVSDAGAVVPCRVVLPIWSK